MDDRVPAEQRGAGALMIASGLMNGLMSLGFVAGLWWMCGLGLLWLAPAALSMVEVGLGVSLIAGRRRPTNTLLPALGTVNSLLVFNVIGVVLGLLAFWQMGSDAVAAWLGLRPTMPPVPATARIPTAGREPSGYAGFPASGVPTAGREPSGYAGFPASGVPTASASALPDPDRVFDEQRAELLRLAPERVLGRSAFAEAWTTAVAETGRVYASAHRAAWREATERAEALADTLDPIRVLERKRALRAAAEAADRWMAMAIAAFDKTLDASGAPRPPGEELLRIDPADVTPRLALDADNLVRVPPGEEGARLRDLLKDIELARRV